MREGGWRRARRVLIVLTAAAVIATACAAGVWYWRNVVPTDLLQEARAAYERRDWDTAAQKARDRLKAENGDQDALRLLARASLQQGKESSALGDLRQARRRRDGGRRLLPSGHGAEPQGERRDGQPGLEARVDQGPQRTPRRWRRRRSRSPKAISTSPPSSRSSRLLTQPEWKARGNLLLGEMYAMMNAPAQTAVALERGLDEPGESIDPKDLRRYRGLLARSLLQTSEPARARAVLDRVPSAGATPRPIPRSPGC